MKKEIKEILLIAIVISIGCVSKGKVITMTMKELQNDIEIGENYSCFKSLQPGDILKIKDEIALIEAMDWNNKTITFITLKSWPNNTVPFEGNLTHEYEIGNKIVITLHIIEIEKNGRKIEFFKEMWDGKNLIPLPPSTIQKI